MMHDVFIFIEAFAFLYLAFLVGRFFMRRIPGMADVTLFSRPIYTILAGFGILGLVGLLCAFFGIFSGWVLRILVFAFLCLSYSVLWSHLRMLAQTIRSPRFLFRRIRELFGKDFYFILILVLWLGSNALIVPVPITGNDTLQYHQPIIQDFINTGRIDYKGTTHSVYGVLVFVELLYAMPSILFGDTVGPFIFQALQYGALIMLLALIYGFVRKRTHHSFLGYAALFFILAIFDLQREVMHGGYIDIFVILFGLASVLLIIDRLDDGRGFVAPVVVLSAFLFGIAIGMKYTALFFAPPIGALLLALLVRQHISFKKKVLALGMYGAVSFLVSGYWYIKNFIFFGNPFYPVFSLSGTAEDVGVFIVAKNVVNMILFPFLKFGAVSATDSSTKLIVAAYFAALYLCVALFFLIKRKTPGQSIYALFFFVHIYMWLMFFNSHQTRFLLPAIIIVPLLLILLGDVMYRYVRTIVSVSVYARIIKVSRVFFVMLFLLLFLGNMHYFYVKFLYKAGFYTEQGYIEKIGGQ
ncbi:MAG: hypothetical protein Q8O83_04895 [bacterium]|nr:hypothetical protein [bacterium]